MKEYYSIIKIDETDKADIKDMAFMCNYKVDKQMLKALTS